MSLLIEHGAKVNEVHDGWTPLLRALNMQRDMTINTLLEHGADPNMGTNIYPPLFQVTNANEVEILLKHGALINLRYKDETPLMFACRPPNNKPVAALLAYHADVNIRDNLGQTALVYAVRNHQTQNVLLLLKAGAHVNVHDHNGNTLLQLANLHGFKDISQLLPAR